MSKRKSMIILIIVSGILFLSFSKNVQAVFSETKESNSLCADHSQEPVSSCSQLEQAILAKTLRIEIESWLIYVEDEGYISYSSNGHGSVINGRYLLTHNHFDLPLLDLLADPQQRDFATVTLYKADGQQLWQGALSTMKVAFEDSETLLLEFKDQNGRQFFESLGIPSTTVDSLPLASIQTGTEVAQINWDNNTAHVQWTTVSIVAEIDGTPVVQLADCIILGASGGGVFVNGTHIANNWSRANACQASDDSEIESNYGSTAALNPVELLVATQ